MRILLFTAFSMIAISACQFSSKKKLEDNKDIARLDSLKHEISTALSVLENFPKEDMLKELARIDEFNTFFETTDYRYTREQYLGEIDQLGMAYRSYNKAFQALPALRDEANLAYEQLQNLRNAFEKGQVSDEEFAEYLQQEQEAANAFLFNYNKRIDRVMMYRDGLDTLIPKVEALRREALDNLNL
ncbi:MAG: hypothetical protein LAT54_05865 [Cryomorphaceae bacterium]|nr:hypothetical protein [Cryomorphaceae bacterium]